MFRGQNRQLKFKLEAGMQINGLGRLTVYPPYGNYQMILEYA
jgi:Exonuclease VII, large subunit